MKGTFIPSNKHEKNHTIYFEALSFIVEKGESYNMINDLEII